MSTVALLSPLPTPGTACGGIRRRNALVPFPLLPPVPKNAVVTSVKIVHNPQPTSPTSPATPSPSAEEKSSFELAEQTPSTPATKRSPTSPTNIYFSPSPKRPRMQRRRSGSRSPHCSPPTSPTSPNGGRVVFPAPLPIKEEAKESEPVKENEKEESPLRRPRSTIVVTVRLAGPSSQSTESTSPSLPPPSPPSIAPVAVAPARTVSPVSGPTLRHKKPLSPLSMRKPRLFSIQSRPQHNRDLSTPELPSFSRLTSRTLSESPRHSIPEAHVPPPPPVPAKPKWNKPRVSSPLVTCEPIVAEEEEEAKVTEEVVSLEDALMMDVDSIPPPPTLYPAIGILRNVSSTNLTSLVRSGSKKAKKAKTGSRLAMLRWAVLNASGPEVGKRIQVMGVRLAKEIWEAEQSLEENPILRVREVPMEVGEVRLARRQARMVGRVVSPTIVREIPADVKDAAALPDGESVLPLTDADIEEEDSHEEIIDAYKQREKLAEECIRELEEMEVDLDVDLLEGPRSSEGDVEMKSVESSLDMEDATVKENVDLVTESSTKAETVGASEMEVDDKVDQTSTEEASTTYSPALPTSEGAAMVPKTTFSRRSSLQCDSRSPSFQPYKRRSSVQEDRNTLTDINGKLARRRSSLAFGEERLPVIMAMQARKWFGKAIL